MTFTQIVAAMIAYLQAIPSRITDFTSTSIVGQILNAVAAQIDQIYLAQTNSTNAATITTSTGTQLDNKGADLGLARKQATAAVWYFTFLKNQASAQQWPIPKGTVISTIPSVGQAPITFTTNSDTYMPAGTLQVNIDATCQTPGTIGNISVNTPLVIGSNPPAGIDGVELTSLTNGTYGTDTETDDAYRSRLLAGLASKAQGTVAWYQEEALGVSGVSAVKVNPQGRGSGTVDVYIVGPNNTLPSTALINSVQSKIDTDRIITDDAKVFSPTQVTVNRTITVKIDPNYDLTATANAIQTQITNYINNLGIGGGTYGALYESQVQAQALQVAGTVTVLQSTTPDADVTFSAFQLPVAGTITVNTQH